MNQQQLKSALEFHQNHELQTAERLYLELLHDNPDNADLLHLLSIVTAQQDKYDIALEYIQQAITINPNSPSFYNSLGNVFKKLNKPEKAINQYHRALQLQPEYVIAYNSIGNILQHQQRFDEALKHYNAALNIQPNFVECLYNAGLTYEKLGNISAALTNFEKTIQLQPKHKNAHLHIAQINQQQNKIQQAYHHYHQYLKTNPDDAEAYNNFGALLFQQGEYIKAIKCFKKAIKIDPIHAEAFHNTGIAFILVNNYDAALKYFLKLLQINPEPSSYYNLGIISMYQEKPNMAINYFLEALKLTPNDLPTLINLGALYLRKEQYNNAIKYYRQALKLSPDNAEIKYILSALENKNTPNAAPKNYLENLFNQYAITYDQHLQRVLQYAVPDLLLQAVTQEINSNGPFNIIDLGCGTGLCGEKFKKLANKLIGVDLSEQMLTQARNKEIYTELLQADIHDAITKFNDLDLILAADTLVYVGNLEQLFTLCAGALRANGYFAFTIEKTSQKDYQLQKTARFAHNKQYIQNLAEANHFSIERCDNIVLRKQSNIPVEGCLYVTRVKSQLSTTK